ncbi:glycosyl hydrolase family 65 protein [Bacillaceae bacterium S4-13-58]
MTWHVSSKSLMDTQLLTEESLYFLGNGYLGIRGNFEETYGPSYDSIRGTYINAFHDIIDIPYGEKLKAFPDTQQKMLNVIDAQTIQFYFGNEKELYTITDGEIISYERKLQMDQAISERMVHWKSPEGKEVEFHFERLVSFIHRELFVIKVTVTPLNFDGEITIVSTVNGNVTNYTNPNDPRVGAGHAKRLHTIDGGVYSNKGYIVAEAEVSKLRTACVAHHRFSIPDIQEKMKHEAGEVSFTYKMEGKKGQAIQFTKWNVYTDTLRHGEQLLERAQQITNNLEDVSYEELKSAQKTYMNGFWERSDVEIKGDTDLQKGIRFNLFHLLQSAGRDKYSNIAAKGLSGEGYEGHYFWDTEIYMFPVFLMTNPELARQLLIYRYSILNGARKRAKEMGHNQGALFPWRTINGDECSSFFPAGSAQYHISADIAYSYIQYFQATHDEEFMKDFGTELLIETARLWIDVGHFRRDGRFAIEDVTGPDEYTCIVNNNYYTNAMAKHNLKWAAKLFHLMKKWDPKKFEELSRRLDVKENEVSEWERASDQMYLGYDEELKINPQDDTFLEKEQWDLENTPKEHFPLLLHYHPLTLYRYQVCKQADTVLAHFLLEDEQELETIENSYDYYEKITTHDSSLSSCVFSIMASKLRKKEKAYHYFSETSLMDLENTHGNTKDGLHMANMGGTWMAIVFGFAGLRIKEDGLHLAPWIPESWAGYSFHIQYKFQNIHVQVESKNLTFTLLEGAEVPMHVYDESCIIKPQQPLSIPVKA